MVRNVFSIVEKGVEATVQVLQVTHQKLLRNTTFRAPKLWNKIIKNGLTKLVNR